MRHSLSVPAFPCAKVIVILYDGDPTNGEERPVLGQKHHLTVVDQFESIPDPGFK